MMERLVLDTTVEGMEIPQSKIKIGYFFFVRKCLKVKGKIECQRIKKACMLSLRVEVLK